MQVISQHIDRLAVIGLLIAFCVSAAAASGDVSPLKIPRVSKPPTLEDHLNAAPREAEAPITDFRQRRPADGSPVSRETSAYLSYDEHNLYVVFVCREDPKLVRARMTKREDIESDDQVVVYLDTFYDRRRAYLFAANPLGIQLDGVITFNYQFTRRLSLRTILDYEAVLPNASLVDLELEKRFACDILGAYFVSPGTAFFVGYTDRYDNLAIDPTVPPRLRRTQAPTTSTGRQFFVKLSYLYRF